MMERLTIEQIVEWGKLKSNLAPGSKNTPVGNVWMDSRKIEPGDLFAALIGDGDDGHHYVAKACEAGAVAAIVEQKKVKLIDPLYHNRLLISRDPLESLHRVAHTYRKRLNIPVVGVTGSNGKTTTRQFIAAVLKSRFTLGETLGNWNNHIGVPLSILRFDPSVRIGVLELAANHIGEIHHLSHTAQPDFAVITNVGYAHIGLFGSLKQTTQAKFEILDGLSNTGGNLLINGDDRNCIQEASRRGLSPVFFGFSNRCDKMVRASDVVITARGHTRFVVNGQQYDIPMPGYHYVYNALPAIFLAQWFGIEAKDTASVLKQIKADPLRGRIKKKKGVTFIIDCYNANPSSMQSGIALLKNVCLNNGGRQCAVVGDMRELGTYTAAQHRVLGKRLYDAGTQFVCAVGIYAEYIADGFLRAGGTNRQVVCALDVPCAREAVRQKIGNGDTVLLKGSRAVELETFFKSW